MSAGAGTGTASRLQEGYRAVAAGDLDRARAVGETIAADAPGEALPWHLLGVVAMKRGLPSEAKLLFEKARGLAPGNAVVMLDLGNALLASGDGAEAENAWLHAARLRSGWAAPFVNLGLARQRDGHWLEAASAFAAAARADPREFAAMQSCVDCVARHVLAEPPRPANDAALAVGTEATFSVVFCSPDGERLERARARLAPLAEASGSELLPVLAPRSLAAAYNEAARTARHSRLLFIHDDVAFLSPAPLERLAEALTDADVVGVAGSERATGPAVLWSGHPYLHGWVTYPAEGDEQKSPSAFGEGGQKSPSAIGEGEQKFPSPPGSGLGVGEGGSAGFEAAPLSLRTGCIPGIETLDGLLLAMRRDVALAVGFDAETFDAFHFYDLDFCVRAHAAGKRLAVTTDVLALHGSRGGFGADWQRYRERFSRKHPHLAAPAGAPHWYGARLPDAVRVQAFYGALRGLRALEAAA